MSVIRPDWPAPANVHAFTTTRATEASPEQLAGVPVPQIRQVHGTHVVAADALAGVVEADAVVAFRAGIGCAIQTADCLPVLLCDAAGSRVAAVHAGWRGLAAGVLESTLDALDAEPDDVMAWIGPAISQPCYEVGEELLDAFLEQSPDALAESVRACFEPRGAKYYADLPGLAHARLRYRGVRAVYGSGLCTFSDPGRFHSWRRDGKAAGRTWSIIFMAPPGV